MGHGPCTLPSGWLGLPGCKLIFTQEKKQMLNNKMTIKKGGRCAKKEIEAGRQTRGIEREKTKDGWREGGGRARVEQVLQLNYKVFHDLWVEP